MREREEECVTLGTGVCESEKSSSLLLEQEFVALNTGVCV